jgi:hypothetical protein
MYKKYKKVPLYQFIGDNKALVDKVRSLLDIKLVRTAFDHGGFIAGGLPLNIIKAKIGDENALSLIPSVDEKFEAPEVAALYNIYNCVSVINRKPEDYTRVLCKKTEDENGERTDFSGYAYSPKYNKFILTKLSENPDYADALKKSHLKSLIMDVSHNRLMDSINSIYGVLDPKINALNDIKALIDIVNNSESNNLDESDRVNMSTFLSRDAYRRASRLLHNKYENIHNYLYEFNSGDPPDLNPLINYGLISAEFRNKVGQSMLKSIDKKISNKLVGNTDIDIYFENQEYCESYIDLANELITKGNFNDSKAILDIYDINTNSVFAFFDSKEKYVIGASIYHSPKNKIADLFEKYTNISIINKVKDDGYDFAELPEISIRSDVDSKPVRAQIINYKFGSHVDIMDGFDFKNCKASVVRDSDGEFYLIYDSEIEKLESKRILMIDNYSHRTSGTPQLTRVNKYLGKGYKSIQTSIGALENLQRELESKYFIGVLNHYIINHIKDKECVDRNTNQYTLLNSLMKKVQSDLEVWFNRKSIDEETFSLPQVYYDNFQEKIARFGHLCIEGGVYVCENTKATLYSDISFYFMFLCFPSIVYKKCKYLFGQSTLTESDNQDIDLLEEKVIEFIFSDIDSITSGQTKSLSREVYRIADITSLVDYISIKHFNEYNARIFKSIQKYEFDFRDAVLGKKE